jgi:hypothetical protein
VTYAKATSVSRERTIGELERTLSRYGAEAFAYGWQHSRAVVEFIAWNRRIRFTLDVPPKEGFRHTPGRGYRRSDEDTERLWEQAQRSRWRALLLVVKAKLEAVEAGIAEFEEEFLAYVVLPDGRTAGELARPAIADMYQAGGMAPLLPALGSGS